jgi:hypothetical protein
MAQKVVPAHTVLVDESGKHTSGQALTCACGRTETIKTNRRQHSLNEAAARRKFFQKGWTIKGGKAICPICSNPPRPQPKEHPMQLKSVSDTPREMSATDRRRVFRSIDDEWDEDRGRYAGGATDQTIATALDVPRIWVETIRRESFGDTGNNAEIEEFQADLNKQITIVTNHMNDAITLAGKFEDTLKDLRAIKKRMERIESAVLPRR